MLCFAENADLHATTLDKITRQHRDGYKLKSLRVTKSKDVDKSC